MTQKTKIIIVVVGLGVAFATGRYTVPVKTVIQTKTIEVEKKDVKTDTKVDRKKHKDTTVIVVKTPDGAVTTTTKTVEDDNVGKDTKSDTNTKTQDQSDTSQTTVKENGHLNISFLAGINPFNPSINSTVNPLVYGGIVTRDIIGPVSCSIWGFSNGTIGVGIGLSF